METKHIWWEDGALFLLDQRLLPAQEIAVRCAAVEDVARAIQTMQVRGAPAIGCTAAYGMAIALQQSDATTRAGALADLAAAKAQLDAARPTAVNLAWATSRMLGTAERAGDADLDALRQTLLREAHTILAEDLAMCRAIGEHGAGLIPPRGQVLTHCNAGGLATAGYGTALAPIRRAHERGRPIHVYVDETRPFMQGARLTAWELQRAGVPLTLITDSMAGYFMRRGAIDCVIVGADRVVANGDTANKIGTYSLAVLARAHDIPFFVAAPSSTVDFALPDGDAIPIEQRASSEVTSFAGQPIAPAGVQAAHPAFDVTPAELITAIITERGVVEPPFDQNLYKMLR
ncbi:MAG: S-methyl-5-thioribose-1-phosphate isomerase [Kouleothrix sp.]|nr:S-methyl-5-thioribose-1-phosphate isomerase [Kouleothrix sp.]